MAFLAGLAPPPPKSPLTLRALPRRLAAGRDVLLDAAQSRRLKRLYTDPDRLPTDDQAHRVLVKMVADHRAKLRYLTEGLEAGRISLPIWAREMKDGIVALHVAAHMAATGQTRVPEPERPALLAEVNRQLGYLDRFRAEIRIGEQLLGKGAVFRAGEYADAAYATGMSAIARRRRAEGFTEERARLGPADHCPGCLHRASLGWQPIGTLLPIGMAECGPMCRCTMLYRGKAEVTPVRVPGTPILPGRPIAERLEAWTEGDELIGKLVAIGSTSRQEIANLQVRRKDLSSQFFRIATSDSEAADQIAVQVQEIDARIMEWHQTSQSRLAERSAAILKTDRPLGITLPSTSDEPWWLNSPGRPIRERADEVESWLQKILSRSAVDELPVQIGITEFQPQSVNQRAQYANQAKYASLAPNDTAPTIAHEVGHGIEYEVAHVQERAMEFLQYRVGDETPISLKNKFGDQYGIGELGRKDDFDRYFPEARAYYVGKKYGGQATEVISMGLEALYQDPAGFAAKDPEFAKFIIGILRGDLR